MVCLFVLSSGSSAVTCNSRALSACLLLNLLSPRSRISTISRSSAASYSRSKSTNGGNLRVPSTENRHRPDSEWILPDSGLLKSSAPNPYGPSCPCTDLVHSSESGISTHAVTAGLLQHRQQLSCSSGSCHSTCKWPAGICHPPTSVQDLGL